MTAQHVALAVVLAGPFVSLLCRAALWALALLAVIVMLCDPWCDQLDDIRAEVRGGGL